MKKTDNREVILLFSGGKDSFLSTCILLEEGYRVNLVTFENGFGLSPHNAQHGADRLIEKYGKSRVDFWGVKSISSFWREFFLPYFNMKPSNIAKEYGELPISQFHCLSCRMAMYIWCIIIAKQRGIEFIADGARKDQRFVIELPSFIEELKTFLGQYEIKILLPVFDLDSKQKTKNQIMLRGFVPKVLEPQCLMGVPLPDDKEPDHEIQSGAITFFNKIIKPRAHQLIMENKNTCIDSGELI